MRAIDSNVLVRLITRDDPRQTAAAEAFIAKGAWVSILALAEAIWVFESVFRLNPEEQAIAVEMLLDHQALVIHEQESVAAALSLFRAKPSLGFSDCLIFELARRAGHLPLGTFDRNLGMTQGSQKL